MPGAYQKPQVENDDTDEGMDAGGAIKRSFLSQEEFDRSLDTILPRSDNSNITKAIIRDSEFVRIAEVLRLFGKGEWSLRPRTFSILRMLGCPEVMDGFVADHRSDFYLPYTENNLPKTIQGAELRSKFIRLQTLVLSHQDLADLEQGKKHIHFNGPADDHFCYISGLGVGKFGTVDHVYSMLSLRQYARKRILRGISCMRDQRMLESFENDLGALKSLSHRHIVKLVGSYTDPICVGLIMSPVADMNLWDYLTSNVDQNVRKQYLRTFFGCLVSALSYLHSNNIRHKDIKPRNMLVEGTRILLTDFGTARIWEQGDHSTTEGPVIAYTPRYSAPEVADKYPRGTASDVWSLGCVFLEMATVLKNHTIPEMKEFYMKNGTQAPHIYQNLDATHAWIKKLTGPVPDEDAEPLKWVEWMLSALPKDRPTSHQVVSEITDASTSYTFMCNFCLSDQPACVGPERTNLISDESPSEVITGAGMPLCIEGAARNRNGTVTAELLGIEDRSMASTVRNKPPREPILEPLQKVDGDIKLPLQDEAQNDAKAHFGTSRKTGAKPLRPRDLQNIRIQVESPSEEPPYKGALDRAGRREPSQELHCRQENPQKDLPNPVTPVEPGLKKKVRSGFSRDSSPSTVGTMRFSILPDDCRPEPSILPLDEEEGDPDCLVAEKLKDPPLRQKDCLPLPATSMVPSYILAGTNRFSGDELQEGYHSLFGRHNFFVYGRFMFPSVLRAIAARSTKGVYSPLHQRRLHPTSTDWAKADASIKSAAEIMTPAVLKGYDRWRPSGMDCAALQDSRMTTNILSNRSLRGYDPIDPAPPGEVVGFVIVGLTEEALRYCDMLFTFDRRSLKDARPSQEDNESAGIPDPSEQPLQRQMVQVDVELAGGKLTTVTAMTYVWSHGFEDLRSVWYPEEFIRGRAMGKLLGDDMTWRAEEHALASIMKISYALPGDCLYGAISRGDVKELENLLEDGYDSNAPCRMYGFPLQAAIDMGNQDMVRLLLEFDADVNAKGGRYEIPLLAASHSGHKKITQLLLKNGADVFAEGGIYVSPLYQAVGHSDHEIAEMLLERGAWLGKNYQELLDLASERRDREMQDLLMQYDVSALRRRRLPAPETRERRDGRELTEKGENEKGDWQIVKGSSKVIMAVMTKFLLLQTQPGSWRGRKGVVVARAAIEAGAPPNILEHIPGAINPIMMLIKVLRDADERQEEKHRKAIEYRPDPDEEQQESPDDRAKRRRDRQQLRDGRAIVDDISLRSTHLSRSPSSSRGRYDDQREMKSSYGRYLGDDLRQNRPGRRAKSSEK